MAGDPRFLFLSYDRLFKAVDMEAALNTKYTSGILDLRGYRKFHIGVNILIAATPTTGHAALHWQRVDDAGANIGAEIVLATAINTKANGDHRLVFGGGLAGSASGMTVDSALDAVLPPGKGKLILKVTEQGAGGDSQVASVFLIAED